MIQTNTKDAAPDRFQRTRMLIGDEAVQALGRAKVLVFGVGGQIKAIFDICVAVINGVCAGTDRLRAERLVRPV